MKDNCYVNTNSHQLNYERESWVEDEYVVEK